MYKKILVGYDGSDNSNSALDAAIEIAKLSKAKIIAFHSIPPNLKLIDFTRLFPFIRNASDYVSEELNQQYNEQLKQLGKETLELAKQRLMKANIAFELELIDFGRPIEAAKMLIEEKGIDLVVIGARGAHKQFSSQLLGSVASRMVNRVNVSVLVVR
ncbi:MAG: universal stress protein [Candidatus Hodarchaeota archaeon]